MRKGILPVLLPLIAGLFISFTFPAAAALHFVSVDAFGFHPSHLEINVGDEVVWFNDDEDDFPHSATSELSVIDANYWNVLLFDYEDAGGHIFNNPGIFNYTDTGDVGTGTIVVNAAAPVEILLVEPRLAAGQFLFDATGLTAGTENVLFASTNLVDWAPVSTNTAAGTAMTFTNAVSPGTKTFRLLQLP